MANILSRVSNNYFCRIFFHLDMVAMLGETTGPYFLSLLRDRMLQDPSGRRILRQQPVVNSLAIDLDNLRKFPEETFGKAYVNFLDREHVSPDTRVPVSFLFFFVISPF